MSVLMVISSHREGGLVLGWCPRGALPPGCAVLSYTRDCLLSQEAAGLQTWLSPHEDWASEAGDSKYSMVPLTLSGLQCFPAF